MPDRSRTATLPSWLLTLPWEAYRRARERRARSRSVLVGIGKNTQVAASDGARGHLRHFDRWGGPTGLADRLRQRRQVVHGGFGRPELALVPDDLPAARRGEAQGVFFAEVVG